MRSHPSLRETSTWYGDGVLILEPLRVNDRDDVAWLKALVWPGELEQKLMRHADIKTTMNIYGDVVTDEMAQAHGKVVRIALPNVN